MSITVVSIPATLTINPNQAFTMQGLYSNVYSSLPAPTVISTTGTVGSIASISVAGPWSATISGMTSTSGFIVGDRIIATNGTGQLAGGTPTSVTVTKVEATSISYTIVGGSGPVSGTLTNISRNQYTVTGISFGLLGMTCANSGIMDTYSDIKTAIARLYNYVMKSYLQPIWNLLNGLLTALQNVVGSLLNIDLTLPILNLHISDLFSDNLYNLLVTSITNLYNTAKDQLQTLLNTLSIPFNAFSGLSSPQTDIANIAKNVMSSLWGFFYKKVKQIIDAIKAGLALYDNITSPGAFPPPLSTIWNTAYNAVLSYIIDQFASGGPTIQQIEDALIAFAKATLNKVVVTAQDIINCIANFTLSPFGKPFDWLFPINPTVNAPWKDINQIIGDIKTFCSNFLGRILTNFIAAINAILSVFGLSLSIPTITINYTVCAVINNPGGN